MEFEIRFTLPGGKVVERKSSSMEAASQWIERMGLQRIRRDETG
jgi:hypothetical protein